MDTSDPTAERRPIASRERQLWITAAHGLAMRGVSANAISLAGMLAGIVAGAAFAATAWWPDTARPLWLLGGFCVQMRLLANMLDGMVAIESGQASPLGGLYNEVPDRVSDAATLIGLGYAAGSSPVLGYLAAVAAVFVAYVRAAARVAGAPQDYCGPMAKPHRMFTVTVIAVFCTFAPSAWQTPLPDAPTSMQTVPAIALWIILLGSLLTAARRLLRAARHLRATMP